MVADYNCNDAKVRGGTKIFENSCKALRAKGLRGAAKAPKRGKR